MKGQRIIISGGTGLLGKALCETLSRFYEVIGTYIGAYEIKNRERVAYCKLDIRDAHGYRALFAETEPAVVIHTASIASPDYAERNKEITRDINIRGTEMILSLCREFSSKFIYISSNGIYDGKRAPYGEEDEAVPVNFYGEIKLEGEAVTLASGVPSAIVRPNIMYGWNHPFERSNVVTLALASLSRGQRFNAYEDVYAKPLFAGQCAEAITEIILRNMYETFNLAGKDRVSIYGLLATAARIFGLEEDLIVPVRQGFFEELVPRPRDTAFRTTKMEEVLGVVPLCVKDGLSVMKRQKGCIREE